MSFIDVLHSFFFFLGNIEGELAKTTIELALFLVVTYMISSEYTRVRRKEYKFLIIGFGAMTLVKLFATYVLASIIFTNTDVTNANFWMLHTLENFAEIAALFLIATAFVYPIVKQKKEDTARFTLKNLLMLSGISIVFSLFLLSIIDLRGGSLTDFWTNTSINVAEIVVLIFYSSYLISKSKYKLPYRINIIFAFLVYSVTPTIDLINIVLYDNVSRALMVAAQPFPFLAILIFTQVIFLKLADKAKILHRLHKSERLYAREKELSKMKDNFVSTVSHELKTPLTSMKLYVGLLKDKKLGQVTNKQTDALQVVDDECNRLNKLITDILDLSKFDAQKQKLDLSEFKLAEIVDNKMYLKMAEKKKIKVLIQIPNSMSVVADKNKLIQVFINLFNNALKFTPSDGIITMEGKENVKDWQFSVIDTGKGIEKEHISQLFNRFYQAENVMTRTQGGFGLGLSIVKSIVDMHKGKIFVESEINKGTCITVKIPKISMY